MRTAHAAVSHGVDDVRFEEISLPDPGPGEVLVEMLACGICGSDLLDWYVEQKAPAVLGHEVVGTVVAVGDGGAPGDPPVKPGDRVFAHHHVPCETCERCLRGHPTRCEMFRRTRLVPGGLSSLFLVPAENARIDLLTIPDDVSTEDATLIEPLGCVLRAHALASSGPESRVLVVGAGQMGLLHVQAAFARGCSEVTAVDPLPERRALAEAHGAAAMEPRLESVLGVGPRPTVAISTSGAQDAVQFAIDAVDDGGTVVIFAPGHPERPFTIDTSAFFFRELTLQASYSAGPADVRAALGLIVAGAVTSEQMTTHRFPLDRAPEAFEIARSTASVRVVVTGVSP